MVVFWSSFIYVFRSLITILFSPKRESKSSGRSSIWWSLAIWTTKWFLPWEGNDSCKCFRCRHAAKDRSNSNFQGWLSCTAVFLTKVNLSGCMRECWHLTFSASFPLFQEALKSYELVFDAVYTPRNTRLLQEATEVGAAVVGGVEMFVRQAIGQFKLFTNGLGSYSLLHRIFLYTITKNLFLLHIS